MKKTLITILATVLVCACVAGGTIAWLTTKTDPITNTFTVGDINITLTESANLDLKMIPGSTIAKDPTVTVKAGSEACYVFVKIDESNNTYGTDKYIQYSVNSAWQPLDGQTGVYYLEQADLSGASAADAVYYVLAGDDISVNDGSKGMVTVNQNIVATTFKNVTADQLPKLTFTAYAVQKANVADAATAWGYATAAANNS